MATENQEQYTLSQEMMDTLTQIKNNPALVIEHGYDILSRATSGQINIPDPTNPFSYLLELAAVQAATLHQSHDITYRNQYPNFLS